MLELCYVMLYSYLVNVFFIFIGKNEEKMFFLDIFFSDWKIIFVIIQKYNNIE